MLHPVLLRLTLWLCKYLIYMDVWFYHITYARTHAESIDYFI